jgi:pimeloyl-ACP methyl ester carboxylesterase
VATRIFLPGFGARARSYRYGLPPGWIAMQPPAARVSGGSLDHLRRWLLCELEQRPGPALLAGHSMGAALAIMTAAAAPYRVGALVLIAPAGLPLVKPVQGSIRDFLAQVRARRHRAQDVAESAFDLGCSPRAALRLARTLRALDLSREMVAIRRAGVPATVVGCTTDTLVTPAHCRRTARDLAAEYRELELDGGHVWMFGRWPLLARELAPAGVGVSARAR